MAPRRFGPPAVPTPNRPRSWWLPERGSRRNAALARGSRAIDVHAEQVGVEAQRPVEVGDEQHGVVEANG